MTGYQGKFGKVPAAELFKRDDWYQQMFIVSGDPRNTEWFLLRTPEPALLVVVAYLVFVLVGPRVMSSRPPLNMRSLIVAYNFAMVLLSVYMCAEFFLTTYSLGYSYACQGVDWAYSTDPVSIRMVRVHWLFFISKILEVADTVFFILRKKNNQVTFLHVYHHATMILNWWLVAKYLPSGQSFFVGMINSWIHSIMYVYYGLAAIGPSMQKYLWWKKHMTTLQLIQFVAIISHTSYNKFMRTDCDYPYLYNSVTFYYTWSMMALFLHFFYTTYVGAKRSARVVAAGGSQLQSTTKMSANGHLMDRRNGDTQKPSTADNVQNNNSVVDPSRERKEQ